MKIRFTLLCLIFALVLYGDCWAEETTKKEEVEGSIDFVEASSPRTLTYTAAASTPSPAAFSPSQPRSSFSDQENCFRDDLAVLELQQPCSRQYLVLRTLRPSLGRLYYPFESPHEIDQSSSQQRQGKGQGSRTTAERLDRNASTSDEATGAHFFDGRKHPRSRHTSKSCWTGCHRGNGCHTIDDIGYQCFDGCRISHQARDDEFAGSCRCRYCQDHRQAAARPQDNGDCGQVAKHCHTQQQASKTTESTSEAVSAERGYPETMDGVQKRDGEIYEPQTHGGDYQTGRNQNRDCPSQAYGGFAPAADSITLADSRQACSLRSGPHWHSARWDFTSGHYGSTRLTYLQPRRHPGDPGLARGRPGGSRGGPASYGPHGDGQGEACQTKIQITCGACDPQYGFEETETENTEETHSQSSTSPLESSFLIRPCPDTGILEKDYHGRSRKVTFSSSPEYITFDPEPDEFGLWQAVQGDSSSLMQYEKQTVVKVWWGGHPQQSEPRQLTIQSTTIEMELLSSHFASLWADHLRDADFSFRRLTIPEDYDFETSVHFLVFPLPRDPTTFPILVGMHSSCQSRGTLTRWYSTCLTGPSLSGERLLRELGLQRSRSSRIVMGENTFSLEERLPLSVGEVFEIFEDMEEADEQILFQANSHAPSISPLPLVKLSIGEPLRGDQILGIDAEDEEIDLTEQPHVGDIHLYGFDTLNDGFLQPRTVVTRDRTFQGFNFIMFALLDDMIQLPRRDAQLTVWTEYNIRRMIYETWREFQPRDIEAYLVIPQPERIARDGCVLVLSLKAPHVHSPGYALALCETITMDRYHRERLADVRHFACLLPSPSFTWTWLGAALSAEERGLLDVDGRIVMVHSRPLPNHLPATLDDGCLVTFLVDRRVVLPQHQQVFALQDDFQIRIEDIFIGRPPRQGVTLILHGHRNGYLGARSISTFRPSVTDQTSLLRIVVNAWSNEDPHALRICGLRPGLLEEAEDGSLEVHLIVIFDSTPNERVGLLRTQSRMDAWNTVELPPVTSLREILQRLNLPESMALVNAGRTRRPHHLELLWGFYIHLSDLVPDTVFVEPIEEHEEESLLQKPPIMISLFDEIAASTPTAPSPPTSFGPQQIWCSDTVEVLLQLDAHRLLPHFTETEELQWTHESQPWTSAPWLLHQTCDELVFYTDGSAGREHGGAGIVLFGRQRSLWHPLATLHQCPLGRDGGHDHCPQMGI